MLGGKLYSIYDPYLMQTLIRSKNASNDHFSLEYAQKVFDLPSETFAKVKTNTELLPDFTDAIHQSFQGDMLFKMNMHTLDDIRAKMSGVSRGQNIPDSMNAGKETLIPGGIEVENLYLWLRDVMTLATTKALYGNSDPFAQKKELVDDIW